MGNENAAEGRVGKDKVKCYKCRRHISQQEECVVVGNQQLAKYQPAKVGEETRTNTAFQDAVLAYFCRDCSPVILTAIKSSRSQPNRVTVGLSDSRLLIESLAGLRQLKTRGLQHIEIARVNSKTLSFVASAEGDEHSYTLDLVTGRLVPVPA